MITFADNTEMLHLESRAGQFSYGCLRRLVIREDGND
jgi:hypothetical protein